MSHFLCPLLLLVFLTGETVVLVKASDNAINCGYDISCHATLKLMTAVSDIKNQLHQLSGEQTTDLKVMKVNLTAAISTLDKIAVHVSDIHIKQVKDVEELKIKLEKSLTSTAAISTQLETLSATLLRQDERLKAHDATQTDLYNFLQSKGTFSRLT